MSLSEGGAHKRISRTSPAFTKIKVSVRLIFMVQSISLDIPDSIVHQAQKLASQNQQRLEDILLEWLTHSFTEHPVETLPNSQLLTLCNMQLDEPQQEALDT